MLGTILHFCRFKIKKGISDKTHYKFYARLDIMCTLNIPELR